MNSLFLHLGLLSWKPFVTALLLPPVPFLLVLLLGGRLRQSIGGRAVLAICLVSTWIACCSGFEEMLAPWLLQLPPALTAAQITELRTHANEHVAIIVLGGGVEDSAPEYGSSSLSSYSLTRLRYGIWLSRQVGWPVGFSGGVGWAQASPGHAAEASVAQRIATQEFRQPLSWVEATSRDTRENAINTVALLKRSGIRRVVLVTHVWHMERALRNFKAAAAGEIRIDPAPMGSARSESRILAWIPSGEGLTDVRLALREWFGKLAGA